MSKKEIIHEAYIEALKGKLEKAQASYEIAKRDTIEAEGRMVTRYDSTKTETAWLADGYLKEVKELQQCIVNIQEGKQFANISDQVSIEIIAGAEYERTVKYELSRTENSAVSENLMLNIIGSAVGDVILVEENKRHFEYHIKDIQKGNPQGKISVGSVVALLDEYGDREEYYIVNYVGGMEITAEDSDVFCISKQTPIARVLLGKEKGEEVVLSVNGEEKFLIEDIL